MSCLEPTVLVREDWGTAAKAVGNLGKAGTFRCVCIAPDSEAAEVELRPNGVDSGGARIIVTKDAPYVGAIEGLGLGIYPTTESATKNSFVITSDLQLGHRLKLNFYRAVPPVVPVVRAPGRYSFYLDNRVVGAASAPAWLPPVPAFGRRRVSIRTEITSAAIGADIEVWGLRASPIDRMTKRVPDDNEGSTWRGGDGDLKESLLHTETITASGNWSWEGTGSFDWYIVRIGSGVAQEYLAEVEILLED